MNTIFFSKKHELRENYYVIPFSCSDITNIDTEVLHRDMSYIDINILHEVRNRIALAVQKHGYTLENVNFRNMAISVIKTKV